MRDSRITSMFLHVRTEAQREASRYWGSGCADYGETLILPDYMVHAFGADNHTGEDAVVAGRVLVRYPLIHAWDAEIKAHYRACMAKRHAWPECVVRKPTPLALP